MNPDSTEEVFLAALQRASPQERLAYLDQACGGDAELRRRVERLLRAHDEAGSFLGAPAQNVDQNVAQDVAQEIAQEARTATLPPTGERPGAVIGPYQLLQELGEGGMGTVWVAKQTEPVQRKVALKLIKPGMDSRGVLARFELERQALALMDHPNIAKVFDAGVVPYGSPLAPRAESPLAEREAYSGRPYFVMELVNGLPLTRFCDEGKLTPRERLELFVPICQAVQHAHQKGIVHRDLKPSNILVTLYDGRPTPKIIDFGVAKAIAGKLTDETLSTQFGAVIGTLEYMAPEQAGFSAIDVDTRADIYSLGVILYELLTGLRPFDRKRLRAAAYDEMVRIIRKEEPQRPSDRVSTDESTPSLAALRRTEPKRLAALLRSELDWVVMKCLEKDRNRRYETASGLAREIQHYLSDEPVEARPPSVGYRLRKFVRRNKGPVLAASLVVLALIGGIVGTSIGLLRALAAERLAGERLAEITQQHERVAEAERQAIAGRDRAEAEAANFKAVNEFLRDDVLAPKDLPIVQGIDRKTTLRELLDRAGRRIVGRFDNQPLVEAALRDIIGSSYLLAYDSASAEPHCAWAFETRRRLLGPDHPHTVDSAYRYALAAKGTGNIAVAENLLTSLLAAEPLRRAPEGASARAVKDILASVHRARGDSDSEKALRLQIVAGARRQPNLALNELAGPLRDLGESLVRRREFAEAEPVLRESVTLWQRFNPNCFDVFRTKHQLGLALRAQKKYAEAEQVLLDAYTGTKTHTAPGAPNIARHFLPIFLESLIEYYKETGKPEEAAKWHKELGVVKEKTIADVSKAIELDSELAQAHNHLAWFLATAPDPKHRNPSRAVELAKKAVELAPESGEIWNTRGVALYQAGQWQGAVDALKKSMELRKGGDGFDWFFLAMAQWQLGEKDEARKWYDRAVQWMHKNQPKDEELLRFRAEAEELLGVKKD